MQNTAIILITFVLHLAHYFVTKNKMFLLHLLGQAILGFAIGAIAKFLVFTNNSNDWIIHGLIGTFGAVGGTRLARMIFGMENSKVGWISAFFGSIVMLAIFYFAKN